MINKKRYHILKTIALSVIIIGAGMNIAHIEGSKIIFTLGMLAAIIVQGGYIKFLEKNRPTKG